MRELSLHILDIVQNSLAAGAGNVSIFVGEDSIEDKCIIEIKDDGHGMTEEEVKKAVDPFYTTRTTRKVGLGLSLLQANAEVCGGGLEIISSPGAGTRILASFQLSHLDKPPLGDMAATIMSLISGYPGVDFFYQHQKEGGVYVFSSREIKELLGGVAIDNPEVLLWIKEHIKTEDGTI